jgi:hypothetical protein
VPDTGTSLAVFRFAFVGAAFFAFGDAFFLDLLYVITSVQLSLAADTVVSQCVSFPAFANVSGPVCRESSVPPLQLLSGFAYSLAFLHAVTLPNEPTTVISSDTYVHPFRAHEMKSARITPGR